MDFPTLFEEMIHMLLVAGKVNTSVSYEKRSSSSVRMKNTFRLKAADHRACVLEVCLPTQVNDELQGIWAYEELE